MQFDKDIAEQPDVWILVCIPLMSPMTKLGDTRPPYSSVAGAKVRVDCLGWRLCAPTRHIHPLRNTFCCLAVTLCKSNPSSITTRSHFPVTLSPSSVLLSSSLSLFIQGQAQSEPRLYNFYNNTYVFFSPLELL